MDDDVKQLFEYLQGVALAQLKVQGAFPPSGALMGETGGLMAVSAHAGSGEQTPERAVAMLEAGLAQDIAAGACRAAGYCVDVKVTAPDAEGPVEALLITMEQAGGEGFDVFVPYDREAGFTLGRPFGNRRPTRLFPSTHAEGDAEDEAQDEAQDDAG